MFFVFGAKWLICDFIVTILCFVNSFRALSFLSLYSYHKINSAAVLSATDSVAVVSLISEKTYPKVYGIVFGEGVINDALAIVIFQTVFIYLFLHSKIVTPPL